ncbi:MAG: hypothetical protein IJU45_00180 [Clostridia bacterium]|nr:hypothetical protein [Clostridia bacterium]
MFADFFSKSKETFLLESAREDRLKKIKIAALICWIIMLAAQIITAAVFSGEQISDAGLYVKLARQAAAEGKLYPSTLNLNDTYIFGNGYVNYLALIFSLSGGLKTVYFLNILWAQLLFFSCFFIIRKLLAKTGADYYMTILFSLLNTFWSEIAAARTELIFTALCFFAVAAAWSGKKLSYAFSGALLAVANWIRPMGIMFLAGVILLMLYKQERLKKFIVPLVSFACVAAIIGGASYASCGRFIYQASTSGYNLFMSANDNADGSYMAVFDEGMPGYIPPEKRAEMTFEDINDYYMKESVDWIKKNPVKYLSLFPAKAFYTFATETYSGSTFFNNEKSTGGIDYLKELAQKITGASDERILPGDVLIVFNQLWYMIIFALFLAGIFLTFKKKLWRRFLHLYAIFIFCTGVTLIIVGGARYHFPLLPIMIMTAALPLSRFSANKDASASEKRE